MCLRDIFMTLSYVVHDLFTYVVHSRMWCMTHFVFYVRPVASMHMRLIQIW